MCDKYLENITSFNEFCRGLSEIERKHWLIVEWGERVSIAINDLEETSLIKDFIEEKYWIEQIMSNAF